MPSNFSSYTDDTPLGLTKCIEFRGSTAFSIVTFTTTLLMEFSEQHNVTMMKITWLRQHSSNGSEAYVTITVDLKMKIGAQRKLYNSLNRCK